MSWLGGPRIDLDLPVPGTRAERTLEVAGWAFARRGAIVTVQATLGGAPPVPLSYGLARPDVAATHGCPIGCGFTGELSLDGQPPGPLTLQVEVLDGRGVRAQRRVVVERRPSAAAPETPASAADGPKTASAPGPQPLGAEAAAALRSRLAALRSRSAGDPSVLDASGLELAALLPGELIVTPLRADLSAYAEGSFDVVVLGAAPLDPAPVLRLATTLVARAVAQGALEILWEAPAHGASVSVSVVIPVFNESAVTDACLRRVVDHWPPGLAGEILVVDDGSTDATPELVARWASREPRVKGLRRETNGGFIAACNAGAAAASGDVLVFLNNDTLVRPGWLPPLLAVLERADAGAVGGKLLYPDGTLQEAGGVVFADGHGCNFGKGAADPDAPLFHHLREVDYCSGAVLATPRALFLEMGGFDAAFAPAYYEDADYAFRLRQRGRKVYYQPESSVVHLEGATAGRDLTSGAKRHQVANRATFAARWTDALADRPVAPARLDRQALHVLRARRRDARRALVILPTMPEPDRECGSRRAFHQIESLLESGWTVSVLVENASGGERYARALRQRGAAVYAGPATRGAGAERLPDPAVLLSQESFDLALVAFWHVAERHAPRLRALSPRTRLVVDSVDLHFLRQARGVFVAGRERDGAGVLDGRYGDEMRRELNVYAGADAVLTVSAKEAGWIDDLVGRPGHALCVPLMEDAAGPSRGFEERRGLVFLANFRHPPNVDALAFLAEVVSRLDAGLLARHPLSIVGNALELGLLGGLAEHPRVHAVGWVPAVEPYLERARLSLVPLRHGAGTKGKVIQSLLAGTPCVSTSIGIEGLDVQDGRQVVVAEEPAAFAAAIARLLDDATAWNALSPLGRAAVETGHGSAVVRERFDAALEAALARTAGGSTA